MTQSNDNPSPSDAIDGEILLQQYLPKLIRLAERNMSRRLQQKIGADEMAGSVLASVVRLQNEGKLGVEIDRSEDFWRLITTIALCKIRKKANYYKAQKRDHTREAVLAEDGPSLEELAVAAGDPTAADANRVAIVLERLEAELDADERLVLQGKWEGLMLNEIAERMNQGHGRSTKTVTRTWQRIVDRAKRLADSLEDE